MVAKSRRDQILMAAKKQFVERGYEHTPVALLVEELGIAKGTFYHHFSSKLDLLDAVVSDMLVEVYGVMEKRIAKEPHAVAAMNAFFLGIGQWKYEHFEFFKSLGEELYDDGNVLFRNKLQAGFKEKTLPIMKGIFARGCTEGVFDMDHPGLMAEICLDFLFSTGDRLNEAYKGAKDHPNEFLYRIDALNEAINRLLGTKNKKIELFSREQARTFLDKEAGK